MKGISTNLLQGCVTDSENLIIQKLKADISGLKSTINALRQTVASQKKALSAQQKTIETLESRPKYFPG